MGGKGITRTGSERGTVGGKSITGTGSDRMTVGGKSITRTGSERGTASDKSMTGTEPDRVTVSGKSITRTGSDRMTVGGKNMTRTGSERVTVGGKNIAGTQPDRVTVGSKIKEPEGRGVKVPVGVTTRKEAMADKEGPREGTTGMAVACLTDSGTTVMKGVFQSTNMTTKMEPRLRSSQRWREHPNLIHF